MVEDFPEHKDNIFYLLLQVNEIVYEHSDILLNIFSETNYEEKISERLEELTRYQSRFNKHY